MKLSVDPLRSGVLLLWCAGLLASGWLASSVERSNRALLDQRLIEVTAETVEFIHNRFGLYESGLLGARGAVAAAGGARLTREQFQAYIDSRDHPSEFPGARGFGFIRAVPRSQEADFLDNVRLDGRPDFRIREIEPHPLDRFIIEHLYPIGSNEAAQGLDIASEVNRREAALLAARAAQARISAPITLVQTDDRPDQGLLMLLPVYPDGAVPLSPDERQRVLVGWVFAPLLLDEVLANLGPRAHQIHIRLTLDGEDKPFFDTAAGIAAATEPPTGMAPVNQFLNVYGQSWRLQASATQALVQDSRITSHTEVGLLGAGASTVLSLLLFFLGQNRRARLAAQRRRDFGTLPPVRRSFTVWAFARSGLAVRALLLYLATAGLLGVWLYVQELRSQERAAERSLSGLVRGMAQITEDRRHFRTRGLRFMASSPSLSGLVRALQNGGVDPPSGSGVATLESNLQQVFAGYLGTSPEARLVSFVGVANNARELVRVEQRNGATAAADASELAALGDEPYLRDTLRLQRNEVHTSDIVLHRTHGALSVPHWPTARYSMPVFDDRGRVFGALVVTVDARGSLDSFVRQADSDTQVIITNGSGDYLVHPDPAMTFGFEYSQPQRWDNHFQLVEPDGQVRSETLRRWRSATGDVLSAREVLTANPGSTVGQLHFIATVPVRSLHLAAWHSLRTGALLVLGLGVAGFAFLYFYWVSAQRTLQARSERLRLAAIVDQTSDAIIGLDTSGTVLSWNRGAQALFGYAPTEAVGHSLAELIVPAGQTPDELQILASLGADATGVSLEAWRRTQDGREVEVAISLSPLLDFQGQVAGASAIVRDVTEERAAQRRVIELNSRLEQDVQDRTATLQAERERLDHIIRGTDAGTWEWNLQTDEKRYNARWAEMLGYTLQEIETNPELTWDNIVHPVDRDTAVAALNRHFRGEADQYEVEMRLRHKSGHWVWVLDRGRVTSRTPDGQPEWLRGIHLDVTQTHQARERLASSEELLDRTGRVAGIGGWEFDVATWSVAWTPPMYDICEVYPDFALTPAVPLQFFADSERDRVKAALRAVRKEGVPFDMEVPFITATGRLLQVRFAGEAIRNLQGEVVRVVGALQDVTARHALDAEMRRINRLQQSILENMPCALSAFDAELRLVAWNTQFVELLELEPLFGKGIPTFEDILRFNAERGEYGTEDVESIIERTLDRARHPEPHSFERMRPNGVPLEIRGTPLPDGGFVTTYTDMSDRKRAEQEVARSEALLRGAIEAVDEAFVLYDPDDRLVLCNEKYR
ncbi:MAG: PAS domain S-box protein, partial [Hydrogenophaga sp.]